MVNECGGLCWVEEKLIMVEPVVERNRSQPAGLTEKGSLSPAESWVPPESSSE